MAETTSQVDEDLIMILLNQSVDIKVRLAAWETVLSLTASEEGLRRVTSYKKYGTFFFDYINKPWPEKETLYFTYKCLISLTATGPGSSFLLAAKDDLIISLLQDISDSTSDHIIDKCYILSNLSQHYDILARSGYLFEDLWRTKLRSCFCSSEREIRDQYLFLSFVLSNMSRTSLGRQLFIGDQSFMHTFICGLSPEEHATKRLGIAIAIRNCCAETGSHKMLLNMYDILPTMLLPLMGSEEYDEETMGKLPLECQYLEETKERETLPQVRKALIQGLSLLCYTEDSWKYLKEKGVYPVVQKLHTLECDSGVIEAIETLVGFLLVENYADSQSLQSVMPAETDILHDIPDVVL